MSDTYCPFPWVGLTVAPTGSINPCCKFQHSTIRTNIANTTIEQYKAQPWLIDLKQQLLNGQRHSGCRRCWTEEDAGIQSMRQAGIEEYGATVEDKYLTVNIALGNLCNLRCRICNARSSTSWIKEYKQFTGIDIPVQNWHLSKLDQILPYLDSVEQIVFPGGEPMLLEQEEHYRVLQYVIDSGRADQVKVHYNTNGTRLPNNDRWDLLRQFREVSIQLSIDDIEHRFEYNRHPAKWSEVYANIKQYQEYAKKLSNIKLGIAYTVSVFTIAYAADFHRWAEAQGLDVWYSRLEDPLHYQCSLFSEQGREVIAANLRSCPKTSNLADYLFEPHPGRDMLMSFWHWTKRLDQNRSQKFQETFPEIYPYLIPQKTG